MRRCPYFVFQKRGEQLGERGRHGLHTASAEEFNAWAWPHLGATLRVTNRLRTPIRLNWIHGGYVKEMGTVAGGQQFEQQARRGVCVRVCACACVGVRAASAHLPSRSPSAAECCSGWAGAGLRGPHAARGAPR
eukprot:5701974-Prymnesium_polylepis.1